MADMGEAIRGAFARVAAAVTAVFDGQARKLGDSTAGEHLSTSATGITPLSSLLPYLAYDYDDRLFLLDAPIDEKLDDADTRERKRKDPVEAFGYSIEIHPQTGASQDMVDLYQTLFTAAPTGTGISISLFGSPDIEPYLLAYERDCIAPDAAVQRFVNDANNKGLAQRIYLQEAERATIQADEPDDPRERAQRKLQRMAADVADQARLLQAMTRRRAQFYRQLVREGLDPSMPFRPCNIRIVLSVTVPAKGRNDDRARNAAKLLREQHASTLRAKHQFMKHWEPDDLLNWLYMLLNPHHMRDASLHPISYDPGRPLRDQVMRLDGAVRFDDNGGGITFGKAGDSDPILARSFTVLSYPKSITLNGFGAVIGDPIQSGANYPCPYLITSNARILDFQSEKSRTEVKAARAAQGAESQMAKLMPVMRDIHNDWTIVQHAFDEGAGVVQMCHELVLFCSPNEVERATQAAQAVFRTRQFELAPNVYMQLLSLLASLPQSLTPSLQRDVQTSKRWSKKTVWNAVNMSPLLGEWSGVQLASRPVGMLLFGRRGQIMPIDLFSNSAGNYNVTIAGAAGSGKSVSMQELVFALLRQGGQVRSFDKGRSMEKLCKIFRGQHIRFTLDSKLSLNPFSMLVRTDDEEDWQDQVLMLKQILAQMISPGRPLGAFEMSAIEQVLLPLLDEKGSNATITDFAQALIHNCANGGSKLAMGLDPDPENCDPRVRDLGRQLFSFTSEGLYGRWFEGQATINFDSNFVVLELDELSGKPELQTVVLFILMMRVSAEMFLGERDRPKHMLVDEAHELLGKGASADFIEALYRRARKHFGSAGSASQRLSDFDASPTAQACRANADWLFLLRQNPEEITKLRANGTLQMDDRLEQLLRSVATRQGLFAEIYIRSPAFGDVARLLLDPFSLLTMSSAPQDMQAVDDAIAQGMDTATAIEHVLQRRGVRLQ